MPSQRSNDNNNMLMDFVSPTGVTDFLQVDANNLKHATSSSGTTTTSTNKNSLPLLNSSFSSSTACLGYYTHGDYSSTKPSFRYAECPLEAPKKNNNNNNNNMAEELKYLKAKLEWIERHSGYQDEEDYHDQLQVAKSQARRTLYAQYEPILQKNSASSQESQAQIAETNKIIRYLRSDNARIRDEMTYLKSAMIKQHQENKKLESANKSIMDSIETLQGHIKDWEHVQKQLHKNLDIFKSHRQRLHKEYQQRTQFHMAEVNTIRLYETCLAKVVYEIQDRKLQLSPALIANAKAGPSNRNAIQSGGSGDSPQNKVRLWKEVTRTLSHDGAKVVSESRAALWTETAIAKLHKTADAAQQKLLQEQVDQLERLQDPAALVKYYYRRFRRDAGEEDDDLSSDEEEDEEPTPKKRGTTKFEMHESPPPTPTTPERRQSMDSDSSVSISLASSVSSSDEDSYSDSEMESVEYEVASSDSLPSP